MIQNTENIFKILKKENFPKDVWGIYDLIFRYKDRVKFVKDSEGVHNLLVLSTNEAVDKMYETDIPHFSLFITKNEQNKLMHVQQLKIKDIHHALEKYLTKTANTLNIQVFFEGSILLQNDTFRMHYILEEKKCSINEAFSTIQEIPEFYEENAASSKEIRLELEVIHKYFSAELNYLKNLQEEEINNLNIHLPELNEDDYNISINKISSISQQITGIEEKLEFFHKVTL